MDSSPLVRVGTAGGQLIWHLKQEFPCLHEDVCIRIVKTALASDDADATARAAVQELTDLCQKMDKQTRMDLGGTPDGGDVLLPEMVQLAAFAAMKQHDGKADKLAECLRTVKLMGMIRVIIEEGGEILKDKYPEQLSFSSKKLEKGVVRDVRKATKESRLSNASETGFDSVEREVSFVNVVTEEYVRHDSLDIEGRPIYKNKKQESEDLAFLTWHRGKFGGHWAVESDEKGASYGTEAKWAPLPFDAGSTWTTPPEADKEAAQKAPERNLSDVAEEVGNISSFHTEDFGRILEARFREASLNTDLGKAKPRVNRLLQSQVTVVHQRNTATREIRELRMTFDRVEDIVSTFTNVFMKWQPEFRRRLIRVLRYLLRVSAFVNGNGEPSSAREDTAKAWDDDSDRSALQHLLEHLAGLAATIEEGEWEMRLAKELPGFPFELSFVQMMILNCRLFGLSRLRHYRYPMSLIRLHDFAFRAWQHGFLSRDDRGEVVTAVRYLDLTKQELTVMRKLPPKKEGYLRFVVVSDTHGWPVALPIRPGDADTSLDFSYARVILPQGDILLHCGDLLNEGVPLEGGQELDDHNMTEEVLNHLACVGVRRNEIGEIDDLHGERDKFKWIFFVGGNHDAPLHMLAANGRMPSLLGDSVVMLQSLADFGLPSPMDQFAPNRVTSVAKSERVLSNVLNGAVRILEDCTLCPPHQRTKGGVVLAGSGMSIANSAWTANRAFQVAKDEDTAEEKMKWAAEQLMMFKPDIVMTHGPPKGHADGGKGDAKLRDAIDKEDSSVKMHVFGHEHGKGFGHDDRAWELHGHRYPGRCFVNASISTSFYLPTRLPIVFDLPAAPSPGSPGGSGHNAV